VRQELFLYVWTNVKLNGFRWGGWLPACLHGVPSLIPG